MWLVYVYWKLLNVYQAKSAWSFLPVNTQTNLDYMITEGLRVRVGLTHITVLYSG